MRKFQRNPYQHNTYLANQHPSMPSTSSSQPLLSKSPTSIPVKRLASSDYLDSDHESAADALTPHISLHALVGNAATENFRI